MSKKQLTSTASQETRVSWESIKDRPLSYIQKHRSLSPGAIPGLKDNPKYLEGQDKSKVRNYSMDCPIEETPYVMWFYDNQFPRILPDAYPENGDLSAIDHPYIHVLPRQQSAIFSIYSSYLFPRNVRNKYEAMAREWTEEFIQNPKNSDKRKADYVYNGNILCVPKCRMPFYYHISFGDISVEEFDKFWSTVQQLELKNREKMSAEEWNKFESWRRTYIKESYPLKILSEPEISNFRIAEMFTEQTIEYIVESKIPKAVHVLLWRSLPKLFSWCVVEYDP